MRGVRSVKFSSLEGFLAGHGMAIIYLHRQEVSSSWPVTEDPVRGSNLLRPYICVKCHCELTYVVDCDII